MSKQFRIGQQIRIVSTGQTGRIVAKYPGIAWVWIDNDTRGQSVAIEYRDLESIR